MIMKKNLSSNNNLLKSQIRFSVSLLLVASLLLFSSCKKFLEVESPNDVANDNMFTDGASLLSARIGLYNTLQNAAYYGGYFPLMIDAYSDNGAAGGYDSPQLNQFNDKALGADNIFISNFWVAAYNTIYTANQIIAHVDGIKDPALSDEVRADVKGEAYCIRALAHFDLLRTFGEHWDLSSKYGIPVVQTVASPSDIFPRNTVIETYDAILADLNEALTLVSNDDVEYGSGAKTAGFVTNYLVQGLMARVYLYMKDYSNAAAMATDMINSQAFSLASDPSVIYTTKLSSESIFELQFNVQDQSEYNNLSYVRDDALRVDVSFLANEDLDLFFQQRPADTRTSLVNFDPEINDPSIQPDGRTQKYRGEDTKDNSAYIMRIAEIYLIRAEARGAMSDFKGCAEDLQAIADQRGGYGIPEIDMLNFESVVQDERRAELNFEGHRYFDLARIGQVAEVVGENVLPVFPIPVNEISATGGALEQYPGY
jgi:hypothetical protein